MRLKIVVVFLLVLAFIGLQTARKGDKIPESDEFAYLSIARDLTNTGTFGDGIFAEKRAAGTISPGRFFAPGYPGFLYLMSRLDPAVRDFIDCSVRHMGVAGPACMPAPVSLLAVQSVFAAVGVTAIFAAAELLSKSLLVAGLSVFLALATGEPAFYVRTYLTENTAFLGFYVFMAAAVAATLKQRPGTFAIAGAALAFAALSRPSYLYLLYVLAPLLWVAAWVRYPKDRRNGPNVTWSEAAAFGCAALAILAPWMMRNLAQFGDTALSAGYGGYILVQRVAYNAMTAAEWGASFIFWLPDFGDRLARALFDASIYQRLGWDGPNAFYIVGNGDLMRTTLAASGGRAGHLNFLLREHVLAHPIKHPLVTLPLTLRGIWVGKYLSLAAVLVVYPVARELARHGRLFAFLVFALAPVFMTALHGLLSVNVVRYNVPMIGPYAIVVAFAIVALSSRVGWLPVVGPPPPCAPGNA